MLYLSLQTVSLVVRIVIKLSVSNSRSDFKHKMTHRSVCSFEDIQGLYGIQLRYARQLLLGSLKASAGLGLHLVELCGWE